MFAGVGNFFPLLGPDRTIYDYAYAHNCAESSFPFELPCRNTSSRPSPPTADASRDPDNVPAKAGNQAPNEVIVGFLDSGHPPAANSGMTGSCSHVIPAQAGIQASFINLYLWIPDLAARSEASPK
jgi:hypothetical protein